MSTVHPSRWMECAGGPRTDSFLSQHFLQPTRHLGTEDSALHTSCTGAPHLCTLSPVYTGRSACLGLQVQAHARQRIARRAFLRLRGAAQLVQRAWRASRCRALARQEAAVTIISKHLRGWSLRQRLAQQAAAAITIQAFVRGHQVRRRCKGFSCRTVVQSLLLSSLEAFHSRTRLHCVAYFDVVVGWLATAIRWLATVIRSSRLVSAVCMLDTWWL